MVGLRWAARSLLPIILFTALPGCEERYEPRTASAVEGGQRGLATYYADALAGHRTANGERYEPGALTAAHRTLPFGTIVEVTREDGRSVRVRINDRGPFGKSSRIIDLSRAAAAQLGMLRDGVVRVTVRVIGR